MDNVLKRNLTKIGAQNVAGNPLPANFVANFAKFGLIKTKFRKKIWAPAARNSGLGQRASRRKQSQCQLREPKMCKLPGLHMYSGVSSARKPRGSLGVPSLCKPLSFMLYSIKHGVYTKTRPPLTGGM